MKKNLFTFCLILLLTIPFLAKADEGMWLPLLISKNYEEMKRLGIKITPEDIYNVNKSSIKDAIVNFGGFCTGEIISKDGLLLTNHHCGFEAIQAQSSLENDLLTSGFWAMSKKEEIPSPGMTVTFLVRMEDVTPQVLTELNKVERSKQDQKLEEITEGLTKKATDGTHYTAEVHALFEGNQYFLFVYEVFKDVRMVGAPPSSIGKFGGDTDNWMWPRHTGDFSVFRVYSGPDGKPADYSKDNIPLKPKHYLPISLKGVKEGDFSMVMGYPGNTERYLPSEGVKMTYEQSNPARIKIREERLAIMKKDMDADEKIRIKYAAKYASVSNYYKYFIGQNKGIKNLNVVAKKKEQEKEFQAWVDSDPSRKEKYGDVLPTYDKLYTAYRQVNLPYVYLEEAAFGTELIELAYKSNELYAALKGAESPEVVKAASEELAKKSDEVFKNYNAATDQKIFAALMKMYYDDVKPAYHPDIFQTVEKKYKGDFNKYAESVFKTSIFASKIKMDAFLKTPTLKVLEKDPGFIAMTSILNGFREKAGPQLRGIYQALDENNHKNLEAILQKRANENLYPDANFTMRLTYGNVKDYFPRDAVKYENHTTLKGVMEKEDPTNEEFIVPAKLKELFEKKDFGRFGKDGELSVCFITTNDITGGNSGSPVINGEGQLIGCAFDGNWEAMSGDIIFEPQLQRCIVTDIRYILFIIDKYAGAGYLLKEMTLVE